MANGNTAYGSESLEFQSDQIPRENENEEEDDYLSMTFLSDDSTSNSIHTTSSTRKPPETSLQRTARLKREALLRSHTPSKAELAERARLARETGLSTRLDVSNNKGAQMLAKLGYKGGALGAQPQPQEQFPSGSSVEIQENQSDTDVDAHVVNDTRITQPIELSMKVDRGGIGMDAERKRKFRQEAAALAEKEEQGQKRRKIDEQEFRERNRREREEKRAEGQMWSAMKVLEGYEVANDEKNENDNDDDYENGKSATGDARGVGGLRPKDRKPRSAPSKLRAVNVLYRPLVRKRLLYERERKMRRDLNNSLSTHTDHNADDNNNDDDWDELRDFDIRVDELDDEDSELEDFEGLSLADRRDRIIHYLRTKYLYCFWCKFRYEDEKMDGCPGLTEDEHG